VRNGPVRFARLRNVRKTGRFHWPLVVVALLVGAGAWAGEIALDPAFTPADLANLTGALADAIDFPVAGPAAPAGFPGLRVLAGAGGPAVDTGSHWWRHGVDGGTAGGVLAGTRLLARVGLPFRIDAGAQVGTVLGERFWGVEGRWAVLGGGMLEPALGVRASYSRLDQGPVDVTVREAQIEVSKGFTVVSPYLAVGLRRADGSATFGDPVPRLHEHSGQTGLVAAGLQLSLPVVKVVAEVRKGYDVGYFLAVGIGL
jgi:hypothetical protein